MEKLSKATFIVARIIGFGIISKAEFDYIMNVDLNLEQNTETVKYITLIREGIENTKKGNVS